MTIFLRTLSICYFVGAALHALDVLNLRLNFSLMSDVWKMWTIYLLFADLFASVLLWKNHRLGIQLFGIISISQLIAYLGFKEYFGDQTFLIIFHSVTLILYFVLSLVSTSIEIAGVRKNNGPSAVGNFYKMWISCFARGISFNEAAVSIRAVTAIVEKDIKHSTATEERFNLIALSPKNRVLHITFCKRDSGFVTRIISVRIADRKERKQLKAAFPGTAFVPKFVGI